MKQKETFTNQAECVARKNELVVLIKTSCENYNAEESAVERDKIEAVLKEQVDAYNNASCCEFKLKCLETENAVFTAIRDRYYPVIKIKTEKDDAGIKTKSAEADVAEFELTSFNRTVLNKWFYRAELLCKYMTIDLANGLGHEKEIADMIQFFKMSAQAATAEAVSNTSLDKMLNEIMPLMIGEEYRGKILSCDVRWLRETFTKKGRGLKVEAANVKKTIGLLKDIGYHMVSGAKYDFAQKQIKMPKPDDEGKPRASAPKPESPKPESPKPDAPKTPVSEKKKSGKASAEKKASTPRKSRASAKPTK